MKILAIETSCDETSASVFDTRNGLLSNVVASQVDVHAKTGGVVPEVASRMHVEAILPTIDQSLEVGGVELTDIDYLAVTFAPGLIGSLLVGVNTAKSLSVVLKKPLMPINHLEGHIYANFINKNKDFKFPAVVLLVSGGHTSLILMKDHGRYKYLGETLDDAAGEAFDKVAKVLDMPYPGGPNVSNSASIFRAKNIGSSIKFPRSMLDSKDFNFSFSGLKTSVLYAWQKVVKPTNEIKEMFAYEFEEAVVDILATKTIKAAKEYKAKTVSICGGVAANKRLREEIGLRVEKELKKVKFSVPEIKYCGDNAAMIAACAAYELKKSKKVAYGLDFEVLSNKVL